MARYQGVVIPDNKHTLIGLTYIYGIGRPTANIICNQVHEKLGEEIREQKIGEISQAAEELIREILEGYVLEGDARREVSLAIKQKRDLKSYQGLRHRLGLPVRGQRTKNNAKTRKKHRR